MAPQPTTYFHSVELQRNKCQGCVSCVKLCPTEAIRVRNGKAEILGDRCIDCGACETRCPYNLPIRAMLKEASEKFDD